MPATRQMSKPKKKSRPGKPAGQEVIAAQEPAQSSWLVEELVQVSDLKPHPRNYREHPEDELEHLCESIRTNGVYKNIVTAEDLTILAGHGVVLACRRLGLEQVPIRRLPLDASDPKALKVLAGDNEIGHLSEIDDRVLTEMLQDIKNLDMTGLLGTGFDGSMLANLIMVTRPQSEIADFNAAAEWIGLPGYEQVPDTLKIIVSFRNAADRAEFTRILGLQLAEKTKSTWWPYKAKEDPSSLRFEG